MTGLETELLLPAIRVWDLGSSDSSEPLNFSNKLREHEQKNDNGGVGYGFWIYEPMI
jgi:hypothetical protein